MIETATRCLEAEDSTGLSRLPRAAGFGHQINSFLAALGILGVACIAAGLLLGPSRPVSELQTAPKATWTAINKPLQLYSMQDTEFGKEARQYEARLHSGGGRQDTLSYGALELGEKPGMLMSLYRPGAETAPEMTHFVDLARQAALAGLAIGRSAQPDLLATRFGAFEVADMVLTTSSHEAACLGYRLIVAEPAFRITGFACGGTTPIDRMRLGCALDRLDLVSAGEDHALGKFFVDAELARRKPCSARPSKNEAAWLDPRSAAPALRTVAVKNSPPRSGKNTSVTPAGL